MYLEYIEWFLFSWLIQSAFMFCSLCLSFSVLQWHWPSLHPFYQPCSLLPQGLRTCFSGCLGYFWNTHPPHLSISSSFNIDTSPGEHFPSQITLTTMSSSLRTLNLVSDFTFCTYLINISSIIQMLSSTWIWDPVQTSFWAPTCYTESQSLSMISSHFGCLLKHCGMLEMLCSLEGAWRDKVELKPVLWAAV